MAHGPWGGRAGAPPSSLSSPSFAGADKPPSNAPGGATGGASAGGGPAESTTVVAEEVRDRCVLCGINFAMFFDQDDVEWK